MLETSTAARPSTLRVNDVHSRLNSTAVHQLEQPRSLEALQERYFAVIDRDLAVSLSGSRHAMGGQQFLSGGALFDLRELNRVLDLDRNLGLVTVEAGIQWPALIAELHRLQSDDPRPWTIRQKQTGADQLTIGGSVSANIHGRGLSMAPFSADIESLRLLDPSGELITCDRRRNSGIFRHVIGGYGLFGIVYSVTLRLTRRRKLIRIVDITTVDELIPAFDRRIAEGFEFGDFQFAVDRDSDDFLRRGVHACYLPVKNTLPIPPPQKALSPSDFKYLLKLAHVAPSQAYSLYCAHYTESSGQAYWSDTHQLNPDIENYHLELDPGLPCHLRGSETISELYVPRNSLTAFLDAARKILRSPGACPLIYGTIRLIQKDRDSFLAWARESWVCTIFNLHVEHNPAGIERATETFRALIDAAITLGGSFYLTYHRFATPAQVEACYPRFVDFLRRKREFDPAERLQSDWYRHYRDAFA